jgi:GGDEF domain-containing protein
VDRDARNTLDAVMLPWHLQPDSYYWVTAQLAARGVQRWTCRLISAMVITFGAVPTMVEFSPLEPHSFLHRSLALGVSACSVVMGSHWLRDGWPSRTVSRICSVVGALCIAGVCLLASDPMVGLLGATSFAVLTNYVGLFHSVRLLAVTWLVSGTTMTVLAFRLVSIHGALTVGVVLLVALLTVFAAFACRLVLRLIPPTLVGDHLEPVTGLLTREGFYDQVGMLLGARSRADDRHLVVVVAGIDSVAGLTSGLGSIRPNQARVTLARCVRETARRDALVAHPGDAEFFIADLFTSADPSPLSERLRHTIAHTCLGVTASIGVVTTPLGPLTSHPPFDVLEELVTIATTAMFDARAGGGNQSRYAINPALTVLTEAHNRPPQFPTEHGDTGSAA